MMDTLMEWAGTPWGITILLGVAWLAVSCLFSVALGRIMAKFGGDGFHDVPKLDQHKQRSPPRRAGAAPDSRERRQKKTSTG